MAKGFGIDREGFTEIVCAYTGRTIGIAAGNLKGILCFERPQAVLDYERANGQISKFEDVDSLDNFVAAGKADKKV